jgi:hypothetical protein
MPLVLSPLRARGSEGLRTLRLVRSLGLAAGLYRGVPIKLPLDKDAIHENLEQIVNEVATKVQPCDPFILSRAGCSFGLITIPMAAATRGRSLTR